MFLLDFCILLDYITTFIILKLTLTSQSDLCIMWDLRLMKHSGHMFVVFHMSVYHKEQKLMCMFFCFDIVHPFTTSAVDMGCCCYLAGALPVCWGLTCLDQRQAFNPTSFSFVNMLTSQYKFNGIVSEPVIKQMSASFGAPSHSQTALLTFYHRTYIVSWKSKPHKKWWELILSEIMLID